MGSGRCCYQRNTITASKCSTKRLTAFSTRDGEVMKHRTLSSHVNNALKKAAQTKTFSYLEQLTNYLKDNCILHEPGRFLIVLKPYGISCVGEPHKEGGVFKSTVYNRNGSNDIPLKQHSDRAVTLSECIPGLARAFNEPNLTFCTGLKRYLSGAVVLPANQIDFENIKKSIKYASSKPHNCGFHYNALTILVGSPPTSNGSLSGYATFQSNGKVSEYIFVEGPSNKRSRTGKFAVSGTITWRVLAKKHGCSLVEFGTNKFARHLPRLMFSHLLCPILGDELYCNRLMEIDGNLATVQPKDLHRVRHKRYLPPALVEHLGVSASELEGRIPLFCHVHSTIFPRFGWMIGRPKSEQDVTDLYASAPPPQHFLAMIEALGMSSALERFFHEDEGEEKIIGGDEKF